MTKKSFSYLALGALFFIVMLICPANAWAMAPAGEGSADQPYQIATPDDLYWFADQVNKGDFGLCAVLTADIVLNEDVLDESGNWNGNSEDFVQWTPIGTLGLDGETAYNGTFDGAGFTISGVFMDSSDKNLGLFGCIGEKGVVQDLTLSDSFFRIGDGSIGGICGCNYGTITRCTNNSSVRGYSLHIGGICGINHGRITECINKGVISSEGAFDIGGICGGNNNIVENCINYGTVTSTGVYYEAIGGICGYHFNGTLSNCSNRGNVTAAYEYAEIGGICGHNTRNISHCSNDGSIINSGGSVLVGGICGNNGDGLITNCYWLDEAFNGSGVGTTSDWAETSDTEPKTAAQYTSGEVAWLLNQEQDRAAWGQGPDMPDLLAFDNTLVVPVRVSILQDMQTTTWYIAKGTTLAADQCPSLAEDEVIIDRHNKIIDPTSYVFEQDSMLWVTTNALPFSDVGADDWFYNPVCFVYSQGLMTGTTANTFEPNTSLSRAMIVAALHRLEGSPQASGSDFSDVAEGDWYAQAVNWAASVGVVNGFEDGSFQPNAAITREQLAAILYNYTEYKGIDVSNSGDLSGYADADQVSEWAADVLSWANAEGLITTVGDNRIAPQESATRAQHATILQRALEG